MGKDLSEHTAPYDAVVQIIDGEAEIIIGGNPLHVATGQRGHHARKRPSCTEGDTEIQNVADDDPCIERAA